MTFRKTKACFTYLIATTRLLFRLNLLGSSQKLLNKSRRTFKRRYLITVLVMTRWVSTLLASRIQFFLPWRLRAANLFYFTSQPWPTRNLYPLTRYRAPTTTALFLQPLKTKLLSSTMLRSMRPCLTLKHLLRWKRPKPRRTILERNWLIGSVSESLQPSQKTNPMFVATPQITIRNWIPSALALFSS